MQVGISPKVKIPSSVLFIIGAILAVLGVVSNDDTLTTSGASIVTASGITFGAGYKASPGEVVPLIGEANDDALSEEVLKELSKL